MKYFVIVLLSLSIATMGLFEADALIVAYSLEDLAEKAEFVVTGEVIEVSPHIPWYLLSFTDGYNRFLFDVALSVEDDLDGKYEKDTMVFRILDSREEFGIGIEDAQNFEVGEKVLVFIGKKEPDSIMGDAYRVAGVTQGKYLLKDGIAFGTHFPEGINEDELIMKIKNTRHENQMTNSTVQSERHLEANYKDFRDKAGMIVCNDSSSDVGFLEYPECGPIDQFVIHVLVIVLPVAGGISGIIIWRKRKLKHSSNPHVQ